MADLQSRIEPRVESHQNLEANGLTNRAAPQARSRRSDRPRTPRKKAIPLLNRIQMDDDHGLRTRTTAQKEKSLIERIEIAHVDQIYRPRQERLGSNTFSGSEHGSHRKRHVADRRKAPVHSRQDSHSHPAATLPRNNVIIPNQDSSHGGGSASLHRPSVTPFVNHLLSLAQRIADVRMETSQVGTPQNSAAVDSSVITAEVLAQFSRQLANLKEELHHHQEDSGPQMFPIDLGDIQHMIHISAEDDDIRSSRETSLNGHGHHPGLVEETIPHEPFEMGAKEPPTPEYCEKGQPPFTSPLPHRSPQTHAQPDPSRRYSSSDLRRKDSTRYHHRTERRSWDHYVDDDRQHSSARSRTDDPDRRYRRSMSSKSRRTYSPYTRNSSPPRHRNRRSSPISRRRQPRSPLSPERSRHSSEKSKESVPRRHSESDHAKEAYAQANDSGSMSLQDLLQNYCGTASPQQEFRTKRVSELNVPGVWFAFPGPQEIGMSTIEFEFDEQTALKWNVQSNKTNMTMQDTESLLENEVRLEPSLELFCFSLHDVQTTMQNLARDVRSSDLVKALSSLQNTWPPQGHLIVSVNADTQHQKCWFPDTFRQTDSIKLEEFLHKGVNLVKFIHLSDLSGKIFVLLATENGIQNDYSRLKFLLPERGSGNSFQAVIRTIAI